MISHHLPLGRVLGEGPGGFRSDAASPGSVPVALSAPVVCVRGRRDEPLRGELHVAARRQGTGLDSGTVPASTRPRWVRRTLLLPDARPASSRRRRQCPVGGDRAFDCELSALLGRTRGTVGGAVWDERDTEYRRRGPCDPERTAQGSCGNRGSGGVRWAWSQVSDLGTRALPRATRGGHREGARAQEAIGIPEVGARGARSTGMTTGRDTDTGVAGGPARHVPVLGPRAVELLQPRDGALYIDG